MEYKTVFLSELKPAKYNPRKALKPTDPEYQRIKRSIEEFGYVDPIIVNSDYTIIGGHQRLNVLKEMGQAASGVIVIDIDKTKEKALNIALNKITGEWDMDQLSVVLEDLKAENFDISLTGFDDNELTELFPKEAQEDDYQPPPEIKTDIQRGDIYLLGRHRVMCGDSTSKEDVEKLMDGKKAELLLTDPPYNVDLDYNNDETDLKSEDEYRALLNIVFNIWKNEEGKQIITIGRRRFEEGYWSGLPIKAGGCWTKTNAISRGRVTQSSCWEPIIFSGEKWPRKRANDVFNFPIGCQKDVGDHPCPKPLSLWVELLTCAGALELVSDPFLGSGTTLIACEQLNRICYGMEISPQYCEVICQRWEKLTGKTRQKVNNVRQT